MNLENLVHSYNLLWHFSFLYSAVVIDTAREPHQIVHVSSLELEPVARMQSRESFDRDSMCRIELDWE
jgi:hypothetical protein